MSHYLDDPEATAEALSADGWLRTGDLGQLDDAGCLRIVGRSKDMFIVGGFNAYPAEIENALLRHDDIQQAAVIGIPDERIGEVGMAFVVLRPGATATGAEIIGWSREQMANYKVPRAVEVLDELPLNATGKVMKETLREQAAECGPTSAEAAHSPRHVCRARARGQVPDRPRRALGPGRGGPGRSRGAGSRWCPRRSP